MEAGTAAPFFVSAPYIWKYLSMHFWPSSLLDPQHAYFWMTMPIVALVVLGVFPLFTTSHPGTPRFPACHPLPSHFNVYPDNRKEDIPAYKSCPVNLGVFADLFFLPQERKSFRIIF